MMIFKKYNWFFFLGENLELNTNENLQNLVQDPSRVFTPLET